MRSLEDGIDWNVHQSCAGSGQRKYAREFGLAHPARNAITGSKTLSQERRCHLADLALELCVSERLCSRGQCRSIWGATARQPVERERRRVRRHAAVIAAGEALGNDVAVTMTFD